MINYQFINHTNFITKETNKYSLFRAAKADKN